MWPGASDRRWGSTPATASWCGRWPTRAQAATAGVQRGDLVVSAGGRPVDSIDAFLAAVDGEGSLELVLVRGTAELTVTVEWPESAPVE